MEVPPMTVGKTQDGEPLIIVGSMRVLPVNIAGVVAPSGGTIGCIVIAVEFSVMTT